MTSEVSIQQAMIGFSIIGDCLSASPKFAETSAFVLMGEFDKELSHATAFNLNRINGNEDLGPDSPEVKQYLTFYLLQALIIQGYKHHIFAVDSRNPDTNIFTVLAKSEKIARSKINKMSKFEREEIANDMSSFFTDYNYNKNKDFNYMRNT